MLRLGSWLGWYARHRALTTDAASRAGPSRTTAGLGCVDEETDPYGVYGVAVSIVVRLGSGLPNTAARERTESDRPRRGTAAGFVHGRSGDVAVALEAGIRASKTGLVIRLPLGRTGVRRGRGSCARGGGRASERAYVGGPHGARALGDSRSCLPRGILHGHRPLRWQSWR